MQSANRQLLEVVRRLLAQHPPFDAMEPDALAYLAGRLALAYHPRGALLAAPASGPADRMFIVKQGCIRGSAGAAASAGDSVLGPGECFPIGALVGHRAVVHSYRAEQDTFCWELAAADFHEALARSPRFSAYCTDRLAALLERAQRTRRAEAAAALSDDAGMLAPLGSLLAREPVWCLQDAPLAQVLVAMRDQRVGAMIVCDAQQVPVGIFTTLDALHRVAATGAAAQGPVSAAMTPAPVTLEEDAPVVDAALAMARHGFRHVVVTRGGRLRGVVSERDLFALQRFSLVRVAARMRAADSVAGLSAAAADIRVLSHQFLAQGTDAEHLTQMTSALNDALCRRLVDLVAARHKLPAHWCWLALGSEGRLEQTLATDQDNALLYEPGAAEGDAAAARAALLAFAGEVNLGLEACGFPLCPGEIMARNPRWCLTLEEWRARFDGWMRNPLPDALLNAAIFFDFRPVAGDAALAGRLREAVLAQARESPGFLHAMAANALRVRPPLGLLADFAPDDNAEFPGTLDLKAFGARPLVDAARTIALARALSATSTAARLRAAAAAGALPQAEAAAAVDAFHYLQGLRLKHQYVEGGYARGAENRIDPDRLNEVDRRVLKAAFRQAALLQDRLRGDFAL